MRCSIQNACQKCDAVHTSCDAHVWVSRRDPRVHSEQGATAYSFVRLVRAATCSGNMQRPQASRTLHGRGEAAHRLDPAPGEPVRTATSVCQQNNTINKLTVLSGLHPRASGPSTAPQGPSNPLASCCCGCFPSTPPVLLPCLACRSNAPISQRVCG